MANFKFRPPVREHGPPLGSLDAADLGYLPRYSNREDYVSLMEGHVAPLSAASGQGRTLVKTYMLETARNGRTIRSLPEAFPEGVSLEEVDDSLFRVRDVKEHQGKIVGLLEKLDDRYPVFYTIMQAKHSDRWIHNNVDKTPWLDRIWLSSPILSEIWDQVKTTHHPSRYVRLGFEYEAKFETSNGFFSSDNNEDDEDEDEITIEESRKSKANFTEKIQDFDKILSDLIEIYDPLNSLVQLQMPAQGKGGHLLNYDGKVTNRSDSFVEHRGVVRAVMKLYNRVTVKAEEKLWFKTSPVGGGGFRLDGELVYIKFSDQLSQETFDRFVKYGLQDRNSMLRIGGYIHRRGPTKIHMSAIDHHLWQPFSMDVTSSNIIMLLPEGTCGNTIHRFVTNIQRYVTPKIQVWLGSEPYEEAVHTARKER